ncbi:MAG: isopentenyl-diphosphate Delta-isomerase [Bacteroidales bacterium]|nr:isopentenyl-diphosphate Delta-isomerase [Bacteroidales bacterium]
MKEELVILVDKEDRVTGQMEKMQAHLKGVLHRAFSVFVFNSEGELMIQQRALSKYHSPGLWTNTCCSHPRPGEEIREAALRRLQEEMGFTCHLEKAFQFIYRADVGAGLTEHELDHVLVGYCNAVPAINPEEVMSWRWINLDDIREGIRKDPNQYTVWFRIIFDRFGRYIEQNKLNNKKL